ncbi:recombination protein RecR [Bacteroidetes/Chlorobi group bacterium ChocPot_Mid]|jgi:recombination protein RecR|nr:MAG: recombination protein RecR [Bacteroidetes/Chlorobi group bacterium ChocPot_Mid]
MIYTSKSIEKIVEMFSSLPTIGKKTAFRLAFFLLKQDEKFISQFSEAVIELKKNVRFCSVCFNYTESDPCPICSSNKRDNSVICVVEEPNDVLAIEKTNEFHGFYHVLHGSLNPLDGITADDLKIRELISRLNNGVNEVILALNPTVEGEVTTQYLSNIIKPLGKKITRIARGIPIGSDLEYADEATLSRALQGRVEI